MYAYINHVVAVVDDFYHLLHVSVMLWNSDESAEASYTVIYMYYVVAHLKFLQFFQRECNFSSSCAVTTELVFMETVENLMVCEEAYFQGAVGESCVQGLGDRGEVDGGVRFCFKDGFQPIRLLLGVC